MRGWHLAHIAPHLAWRGTYWHERMLDRMTMFMFLLAADAPSRERTGRGDWPEAER